MVLPGCLHGRGAKTISFWVWQTAPKTAGSGKDGSMNYVLVKS